MSKPTLGSSYLASYSLCAGTLSLGVKRLGCEANHLPLSSAKVKNEWSCASSAPRMPSWCVDRTALALPYWGPWSFLSFGMWYCVVWYVACLPQCHAGIFFLKSWIETLWVALRTCRNLNKKCPESCSAEVVQYVTVIIFTCVQVFICNSWQHSGCASPCLYILHCHCFVHTLLVFIPFKCE
jgi:hypothetical protein